MRSESKLSESKLSKSKLSESKLSESKLSELKLFESNGTLKFYKFSIKRFGFVYIFRSIESVKGKFCHKHVAY